MIYLDNGATSFPKPRQVVEAVGDAMMNYCANPGRSSHFMAARTAHEIYKARVSLSALFGIEDAGRIVFTKNCTEGINMAFKGVLRHGDHVITSSMEHNSVIRPLAEMKRKGEIDVSVVKCSREGRLNPGDIKKAIRDDTRMIVLTAASNVTGTIMPIEEVGRMALRHGILFMVDGAQGAGHMELDVRKNHIDILAVPGHKGLMGPQGTGFLYVRENIRMIPFEEGGTGTKSREIFQPRDFPEGYEAGTLNSPGIIGLGAAAVFLNKIGIPAVVEHERKLMKRLECGLRKTAGVTMYGTEDVREKTAVAAFNIAGYESEEAAMILNDRYGIAVRGGLHCSGTAHETIGTEKTGCIRMSPGFYTCEEEIDEAVKAVNEMAKLYRERNNRGFDDSLREV